MSYLFHVDQYFVQYKVTQRNIYAQKRNFHFVIIKVIGDPRHFRGSVNCEAPSIKNSFQVVKFVGRPIGFIFFCLVKNSPVVIWVSSLGLRDSSKWSLRPFQRPFGPSDKTGTHSSTKLCACNWE